MGTLDGVNNFTGTTLAGARSFVAPTTTVGLDVDGDGRSDFLVSGTDRNRDGIPDAIQGGSTFAYAPRTQFVTGSPWTTTTAGFTGGYWPYGTTGYTGFGGYRGAWTGATGWPYGTTTAGWTGGYPYTTSGLTTSGFGGWGWPGWTGTYGAGFGGWPYGLR